MQAIFAVLSNGSISAPTPVPPADPGQDGALLDFTEVMSDEEAVALVGDTVVLPADFTVTEGGALPLPLFWLPFSQPLSMPTSVEATDVEASETAPPVILPLAAPPSVAADEVVPSPVEISDAPTSPGAVEASGASTPVVALPEGTAPNPANLAATDRPVPLSAPVSPGQDAPTRQSAGLATAASPPLAPLVIEPTVDASGQTDTAPDATAPVARADGVARLPATAASWPAVHRTGLVPTQVRTLSALSAPSSAQVEAAGPPEGSPPPAGTLPDGPPRDDRQPDSAHIQAVITGRTTPDALSEPPSVMPEPATPAAPSVSAEASPFWEDPGKDVTLDAAPQPDLPTATMRGEKSAEATRPVPALFSALAPTVANASVRPLLPAWLELAELDQRAELDLGAVAAAPAGSAASASTSPAAIVSATQPLAQVLQGLARHQDGTTEITLSPEELGTVRLRLRPDSQDADRMVVMLSFDRPETMDLFRRHADQLAEAIRSAGYAGVDIGFDQGNRSDGSGFAGTSDTLTDDGGEVPSGLAPPPQPPSPRAQAGTGLDLRL